LVFPGKEEKMTRVRKYSDVCTVDIYSDISDIGPIFLRNHHETVFVIDSERYLHGIITMGDFFRNSVKADTIRELMNKDFIRINENFSDKAPVTAMEVFSENKRINAIPVVDDGKLQYIVERSDSLYDSKALAKMLKIRKDNILLEEFVAFQGVKTMAVIAENGMIDFLGEILSNYTTVEIFENYESFRRSKTDFDLILVGSMTPELKRIEEKGSFIVTFFQLLDNILPAINKTFELKRITDMVLLFILPYVYEINNPSETEVSLTHGQIRQDVLALAWIWEKMSQRPMPQSLCCRPKL